MSDCLFCKILKGDIPSKKVFDGEHVYGFEDINAQAPVHILLIPKKHIPNFTDVSSEDAPILLEMFAAVKKLAHENGFDESGFRTVINEGPDSGQEVFHLHMHLLAKRKLGWPPG